MISFRVIRSRPFSEEVLGIHDVYARSKESLAQRFIAHSGIDPQGVVFAGDSVHDYEVASAAGCRCVLIANGHEHKDKLKQCGCRSWMTSARLLHCSERFCQKARISVSRRRLSRTQRAWR